eukprot:Blabericola_migrator_1__3734@NODE_211_length_11365_cov_144_425828_g181_i0_p1_GENE_NODE_211_length_11365_cov_144_425828_g181_i0NODE_211_length_11365_cov_144_425828_g181_i0_p1_ORF_typecomplete_len954_score148_27_NODE_211_length_11365_cov_144_425828_g181_i070819942
MHLAQEAPKMSATTLAILMHKERRALDVLYSYVSFKAGWCLGGTCKALWTYTMFHWQPSHIDLSDPGMLNMVRYSKSRAGGRSNIFFSNRSLPLASFFARVSRTLKGLRYEKTYWRDDRWRRRVLSPEYMAIQEETSDSSSEDGEHTPSKDSTEEILKVSTINTQTKDVRPPFTEDNNVQLDTHLSFLDLAVFLLGSSLSLEEATLSCNWDPGAPISLWLGLPPIRDCEWYMLCPSAFPPVNGLECGGPILSSEAQALFDHDQRLPGPLQCVSQLTGGVELAADDQDHLGCCKELDLLVLQTGQALRSPVRISYQASKGSLSSLANPSRRPDMALPKLKKLTLQPPSSTIHTRSCWALLCLLRGLKLTSFPGCEELALLGDFVTFGEKEETGQEQQHALPLEDKKSLFTLTSFEDTELWVRDMVNLYLCGEIPIRDSLNFSPRRFLNFATKGAIMDQQKYWRGTLEEPGVWSFPKLKKLTLSGTNIGDTVWQRLVICNMLPPESLIETLELDRTIRSPNDVMELPYDNECINNIKFPRLSVIIVRCVYGIETLATVQRLFSRWLDREVVAQTRELVLTDLSEFAVEAHRLECWPRYQSERLARQSANGSINSFNSEDLRDQAHFSSELPTSFFPEGSVKKMRFRMVFGGETYDPDVIEDKLRQASDKRSATPAARPLPRDTSLERLDVLWGQQESLSPPDSLVYFYDIGEIHFDIGTYEASSKSPGLFDIVSDRLMRLRFIKGSYSRKALGRVSEYMGALAEEDEEAADEEELGHHVSFERLDSLGHFDGVSRQAFKIGRIESSGKMDTSRNRRSVLDDVTDVGLPELEARASGESSSTASTLHRAKMRLNLAEQVDDHIVGEHRRSVGVTPYDWATEPPDPHPESTVEKIQITLRYNMTIADLDKVRFGPKNAEAFRRVQTARKWPFFNPTLVGAPHKTLELKISPEKAIDQ